MTTQEKNKTIAEWLGYEIIFIKNALYIRKNNITTFCNFLKDRNQQKLIEDKLIEMECSILDGYDSLKKIWSVCVIGLAYPKIDKRNKSKNKAFVDAIIELIKSEKNNKIELSKGI